MSEEKLPISETTSGPFPPDRLEYWIGLISGIAASVKPTPDYDTKLVKGEEIKVCCHKIPKSTIIRQARAFRRFQRQIRQMNNYFQHRQRIEDSIRRSLGAGR